MSKISKKYLGPDQVDGSILKLEKDQAVRIKKQDGSEVQLVSLDIDDNPMMLGSRLSKKSEHDALQSELNTEKGKVSSLQSDMSLAQSSISTEISRAESAEGALDARLDIVEPKVIQLESDVTELESYDLDLRSDVDELESYSLDLRSDLDQEISDRSQEAQEKLEEAQDYADAQIAAIPAVDLSSYETIANVDSKDDATLTEAKAYTDTKLTEMIDGPSFGRFNAVVGATTSEFMLDKSVKGIMSCSNGRVALHEGFDFTVSVDSMTGFSKLTFIGPSAAGGASEIESTDQIFAVYAF